MKEHQSRINASGLASVRVVYMMTLGKDYGYMGTISGRQNVNIDSFNHIWTKFWYGLWNIKNFLS
jgi:hypothetical protein